MCFLWIRAADTSGLIEKDRNCSVSFINMEISLIFSDCCHIKEDKCGKTRLFSNFNGHVLYILTFEQPNNISK